MKKLFLVFIILAMFPAKVFGEQAVYNIGTIQNKRGESLIFEVVPTTTSSYGVISLYNSDSSTSCWSLDKKDFEEIITLMNQVIYVLKNDRSPKRVGSILLGKDTGSMHVAVIQLRNGTLYANMRLECLDQPSMLLPSIDIPLAKEIIKKSNLCISKLSE